MTTSNITVFRAALAAITVATLTACGGGGDDGTAVALAADDDGMKQITAVATTNTLVLGAMVPGFPHKVDVYRPAGATRAIVFLHGHGGRSWQIAYELGLNKVMQPANTKNIDWDWLSRNGIIAVFPQGQAKAPIGLPTWSNHVLSSGQNDTAFLAALSSFVKAQYGATQVALAGHSSGGTMTARMWCEGTTAFKAYYSVAGPMASATYPLPSPTCTPLAPAPYAMMVGGSDSKLTAFATGIIAPTAPQIAAGLTASFLVAEWTRHEDRAAEICGQAPVLENAAVATWGSTWDACGAGIRYQVVTRGDHSIVSLEKAAGLRMIDAIAAFTR